MIPAITKLSCWTCPSLHALIIKRVVGLPGQTIEILQGQILVDGREVSSSDVGSSSRRTLAGANDAKSPASYGDAANSFGPVTLADDLFFVLGDNRDNSNDSRTFGPVHRDMIKGRIWVRYWPLTRFTIFR